MEGSLFKVGQQQVLTRWPCLRGLGVLEQTQASAGDFTDVIETPAFDLVAVEGLKMRSQGNAGGHEAFLTVENYYYSTLSKHFQD